MFKRFLSLLLCALLLTVSPAMAEMKRGKNVQLVVCGELISLNDETGYIGKDGSNYYIPLVTVAKALGYTAEVSEDGTMVTVHMPEADLVAADGYEKVYVNGKKQLLPAPTVLHDGVLLCSYEVLPLLNAAGRLYKLTNELTDMGYEGPTAVINRKGGSLIPPALNGNSFVVGLEASKSTDQIVAVQCDPDGRVTLSFHEKQDDEWHERFSGAAIIGRNGLGKTEADDGKTPRGTYDLIYGFGTCADPGTELPYAETDADTIWCRTPNSGHYNRIVNLNSDDYSPTDADIVLAGDAYRYGIIFNYNRDSLPEKGTGICIRCMSEGETATDGCIAVSEELLKSLLLSLKAGAKIVIF